MDPNITGVNVCVYAERLFTNYLGWVDLLDMDNVVCRRADDVVPIERCTGCFDMETEAFLGPAKVIVGDMLWDQVNLLEEEQDGSYYEGAEYPDYPE